MHVAASHPQLHYNVLPVPSELFNTVNFYGNIHVIICWWFNECCQKQGCNSSRFWSELYSSERNNVFILLLHTVRVIIMYVCVRVWCSSDPLHNLLFAFLWARMSFDPCQLKWWTIEKVYLLYIAKSIFQRLFEINW